MQQYLYFRYHTFDLYYMAGHVSLLSADWVVDKNNMAIVAHGRLAFPMITLLHTYYTQRRRKQKTGDCSKLQYAALWLPTGLAPFIYFFISFTVQLPHITSEIVTELKCCMFRYTSQIFLQLGLYLQYKWRHNLTTHDLIIFPWCRFWHAVSSFACMMRI